MAKSKGRKPDIVTPRGLRGMRTESGRVKYYSNEWVGGKRVKKYWGYDPTLADRQYLAYLASHAPAEDEDDDPQTEEEYLEQQIKQDLVTAGYTPEHLQAFLNANRGDIRLTARTVRQEAMAAAAQRDLTEARRELKYLRRGQQRGPSSKIKTVMDVGEAWKQDKPDMHPVTRGQYISAWKQFCEFVGDDTRVEDLNKATVRKYRDKVRKLAGTSAGYATTRFRKVKAVVNHVLTEYDVDGVSDEAAVVIRGSYLSLLKQEIGTPSPPRPITKAELHALLAVCDQLAMTDTTSLRVQLSKAKKGSHEYQSLAAQINKAEQKRLLGVQFRAIYLTALNLAFYAVDIARFPVTAINFETGEVVFPRKKKNTVRVGVLFAECLAAIQAWLKVSPNRSEFVFVNSQGSQWNRNHIARNLNTHKDLSEKRKAPLSDDLTFSGFRDGAQTAAQVGLANSRGQVDERLISILAGHSIGIGDRYILRNPSMMRPISNYIRAYYFGKPEDQSAAEDKASQDKDEQTEQKT